MIRGARRFAIVAVGVTALVGSLPARSVDLYRHDAWAALATDRVAQATGDSLTVLVFENASASNSAQSGSSKKTGVKAQARVGTAFNQSGELSLDGSFTGSGTTARAGKMVAQISVVVDHVLPNGDLHVSGQQLIKINGERTNIKLQGRVRRADIANDNSVLSSRLADALIDYDGTGFVSKGARPGIVARIFSFLGLV